LASRHSPWRTAQRKNLDCARFADTALVIAEELGWPTDRHDISGRSRRRAPGLQRCGNLRSTSLN
jgi:hypothetical protein